MHSGLDLMSVYVTSSVTITGYLFAEKSGCIITKKS